MLKKAILLIILLMLCGVASAILYLQPEPTWERQGTVIKPVSGIAEEPNVIYENGIFKMWYHFFDGTNSLIQYSESKDGKNFGEPITVLSGYSRPTVIKNNGYYYLVVSKQHEQLDIYSSLDGKFWNIYVENIYSRKGWASNTESNTQLWIENGQWNLLIEAINSTGNQSNVGYIYSNDGKIWKESPTNPVIIGGCYPAPVQKINGVYYTIVGLDPSDKYQNDFYIASSSNLELQWIINQNKFFEKSGFDEGVGSPMHDIDSPVYDHETGAGICDPCIIEVNGVTYLYYSANRDQFGKDPENQLHIKLATINKPISEVMT